MLTPEQKEFLQSRYVNRATFQIEDVIFDCWEGEWVVTKNGQHVDVFTFSRYTKEELEQTLHDIFYNTEAVTFN